MTNAWECSCVEGEKADDSPVLVCLMITVLSFIVRHHPGKEKEAFVCFCLSVFLSVLKHHFSLEPRLSLFWHYRHEPPRPATVQFLIAPAVLEQVMFIANEDTDSKDDKLSKVGQL